MILSITQWAAVVCVIGMSLGQVLFKVSAMSLNETGSIFAPRTFLILAGTFFVYVAVSFGWVWVLRKAHLGEVFPFYSLAYILVPLASYHLFDERFSSGYLLGVALIIGGLLLCGRG
jgi:drug/metabolite transporter (DMT)-like permease